MNLSIFSKHVIQSLLALPLRFTFHAMGKKQSGSAEKKPTEKKGGNSKNTDKGDQSEGKVSYNSRF